MKIPASAAAARGTLAAALIAACLGARAESMSTMAAPEPVVAVVRVAKPWYAPRFVVVGRMRDTIEQYAHVPGLEFKAYSFERSSGDYGGVYVWKDRAAAQTWFDAAWHARVQKERGVPGRVTLYDAPVSVDNSYGALGSVSEGSAVVTVVQLPLPPGAERARVVAAFEAAVPQYRNVPGLLRKHFVLGPDGTFGGVYLWKDEAVARAFFDDAWFERGRRTYGAQPAIEWYDAPILLPTAEASNRVAAERLVGGPR